MKLEARAIPYAHTVDGQIYGVFRPGEDRPLFVVAPSAALRGGKELGLYAAIDFPTNMFVGSYDGAVLGEYATAKEASESAPARRQERLGNTMMLVRKTREGKYQLMDGRKCGPPYLNLCNDPKGTRRAANLRMTEFGGFYTTASVPAFDLERSVHANGASELLWSYGRSYWQAEPPAYKSTARKSVGAINHGGARGGGAQATRDAPGGGDGRRDRAPARDARALRPRGVAPARKR
jgi:hypothetical protein